MFRRPSQRATEELGELRSAPQLLHALLQATCRSIELAASLRSASEGGDAFDAWAGPGHAALVAHLSAPPVLLASRALSGEAR